MNNTNTIGDRVRDLMERAQMNQSQLADMLDGFDRFAVMNLVKGKTKNPKSELIAQIARVFHTSEIYLRYGQEEPVLAPAAERVGEAPQQKIFKLLEELEARGIAGETTGTLKSEIMKILFKLTDAEGKVIQLMEQRRKIEKMLQDELGIKFDE